MLNEQLTKNDEETICAEAASATQGRMESRKALSAFLLYFHPCARVRVCFLHMCPACVRAFKCVCVCAMRTRAWLSVSLISSIWVHVSVWLPTFMEIYHSGIVNTSTFYLGTAAPLMQMRAGTAFHVVRGNMIRQWFKTSSVLCLMHSKTQQCSAT